MPATAGIQPKTLRKRWIPAFAGMTHHMTHVPHDAAENSSV